MKYFETFLIQEGFFMQKNHLFLYYELEQIYKGLSVLLKDREGFV